MEGKKLVRNKSNKMIGGVCSGVADYFGVDPTVVRIVWVLLAFGAGVGILAYIACWIIMPEA